MVSFILRRLGIMVLTALCLTFIVFWLTNLFPNLEKLAKTQGNFRMSDEAVLTYLGNNGYLQPLPVKYGQWLGVLPGYVIAGTAGKCVRAVPQAGRTSQTPPVSVASCRAIGVIPRNRGKTSGKLRFAGHVVVASN